MRKYDYWGAIPHRRKIFSLLTTNVDAFISPSQALIERHVEYGYERSRFRLIRYGIRSARTFGPKDPSVARLLSTSNQWRTLVFSGGGAEIKGARVVQEAIPEMLETTSDLRIIVAGGGDLIDQYKGINSRVVVLGPVNYRDMPALFAIADLVLVPSVWHENLPIVIYESFQQGSPVIGSNIGGIPEIVESEKTGYLIDTGSSEQMISAVARHFASTPAQQRAMRQNCYAAIMKDFGFDTHIEQTISLYRELLPPA